MKKLYLLLILPILIVSCDYLPKRNTPKSSEIIVDESIIVDTGYVDTLALTLEALRHKRLPARYVMSGDVKTEILFFVDYRVDDIPNFVFLTDKGEEVLFNRNDTRFDLLVKAERKTPENGGYQPNPVYKDKRYRVVWRNILIDGKPENEHEYFHQNLEEIIFLKEINEYVYEDDEE